jgi:hypothetical protein
MTGYIQANILGKTRGLKFGMLAAEKIISEMVTLNVQLGDSVSSSLATTVIYWGLYNNCFVKREVLDVTFEQVADWTDQAWFNKEDQPVISEILSCFFESQTIKSALGGGDESKKKDMTYQPVMDGMSSSPSPLENSASSPSNTTTTPLPSFSLPAGDTSSEGSGS